VLAVASVGLLAMPASAAELQKTIIAGDGAAYDVLASSVAIDRDLAVVGAPHTRGGRGAVLVYRRVGNEWTLEAKLTASNAVPDDGNDGGTGLGTSVAINQETIVAGAPQANFGTVEDAGAVYTFDRAGAASRTESAILTVSDAQFVDRLGDSVAIDGDMIVAGAPCATVSGQPCQGTVFTFATQGPAARSETGVLNASDGRQQQNLGSAVAVDGDTIVASAPNHDAGVVYTFARDGATVRTETARLTAPDARFGDRFGSSVAIVGDKLAVGAPQLDVGGRMSQGAVYTFTRTGEAQRTPIARLTATDGAENDQLGATVAIDGTIVAGAPGDAGAGGDAQGSVYRFAGTGGDRTEFERVSAANGSAGDRLGDALDVDGATLIAGAPRDKVGLNINQGSATIFFIRDEAFPPPVPEDTLAPAMSRLSVRPTRFTRSRGGRVSYRLSEGARVRFRVQRLRSGRYRTLPGSFSRAGRAGDNSSRLPLRLAGRRLKAGRYRLVAAPRDAAGNTGTTKRVRFRILGS
jgi:hypothetical protein